MFAHDPYQNYSTWGQLTPFGIPYTALQNPGTGITGYGSIPGYGLTHPQQLQQAVSLLAAQAAIQQQLQQNPLLTAVLQSSLHQQSPLHQQNPLQQNPLQQNPLQQNPLFAAYQNPLTAHLMQNPLAFSGVQNPQLNPILSQQPQFGQFGGLQPQSWIGQGGLGVGQPFGGPQSFGGPQYGAIHPLLAQLGVRAGQTPGMNPWGIC